MVTNNKLWQLRVREGAAVRDTIDIGTYSGTGSYADEQEWLWRTIARLAAERHLAARTEAKKQGKDARRRENIIREVELWLTTMGVGSKQIDRIVNNMRKHNEDHESWSAWRQMKGQSSTSGEEGS